MAQTVTTAEVESAPFSHMVNQGTSVQAAPNAAYSEPPQSDAGRLANDNLASLQSHETVTVMPAAQDGAALLAPIPMSHGLILAGILFAIGLCGVMVRRNFLFMLMSLEIMMNAAALAFIVGGSRWVNPDGQVMFIFILTLVAAEAAIGLAILLQFYHKRGHLDVDSANEMKG